MNLVQALGVAAAALVMAMSSSGIAPARGVSEIAAEARARLAAPVRHGAVAALAAIQGRRDALPEMAARYDELPYVEAEDDAGEVAAIAFASEWTDADSACASARSSHAEPEHVEVVFDRAAWRHSLPDAKIHIGRRMARL
jgi:hypothetical protein